ncbi:MAG: DUF308 domain-containing protein [Selenomonadaceae bacterium]|nr:DUF308 domain-containing protein [Selenomonadaceae bacterium]
MFVAVEFQNMRSRCPSELETLLKKLSISKPDWSGDEYRIYEQLDNDITKKICAAMKSSSVIEGYTNILKLGGIAYDYSETDNELLRKIVANGDKILRGLENFPKFVEVEVSSEPQPQQPPPRHSQPKTKTVTNEEHITLKGPIVLGVILIVVGLAVMFALGIGGIILAMLGAASLIAGIRGKTVRTSKTVTVDEDSSPPQKVVSQPVRQMNIVRKEVKPPFTRNELQNILDVLAQIDKIVRAI